MKPLALIVALAKNRGIGLRGALPWHLPEDLKRFKALTMGHAIIMGRKTHESIGKALPGRRNVVVTRSSAALPGCEVAGTLDAALKLVEQDELPFIIGGAQLYAEALPRVTHLFLTQLDRDVEADTFFPELDDTQWREVKREPLYLCANCGLPRDQHAGEKCLFAPTTFKGREHGAAPDVTFVDLLRSDRS